MLRKKPNPNLKKKVNIYQTIEKAIEACGPQIFRFLKTFEIQNLRQVNRLFYYQLLTFDVWNGLVQGIKEYQNNNNNNNNVSVNDKNIKRKLLTVNEEQEDDEKDKLNLEQDYQKMNEYNIDLQNNNEESDSDEDKDSNSYKKKKIQTSSKQSLSNKKEQKEMNNTIKTKLDKTKQNNIEDDIQKNKINNNPQSSDLNTTFEQTPIIKKRPIIQSKVQFDNQQLETQTDNSNNKSINSSQIKLVRRSSLLKDGKYSQLQQSTGKNTDVSTSISSKSSSNRQGSSDIRISNNQIQKDLEKSNQILQKKTKQLDEQMKTKNINNNNIFSDKNDSIIDPLQRTSNSFFKKSFFDRLNQNGNSNPVLQNNSKLISSDNQAQQIMQNTLRPQTNMQLKRGQNQNQQQQQIDSSQLQWLKIPQNILDNLDNLFDIKKSYAQNMKSFEDLNHLMDNWIYEIKKLEKALDAQSITTDTLIQEINLWSDLTRIIDLFKKECENENVGKIERIITEKCFTDEGLKKKLNQYKSIKKNILIDRLSKRNFSNEFSQECTNHFKSLMKAQFSEFPEIFIPCLQSILQLYQKYTVVFDYRIFYVMDKIYLLLINKMKQCQVSIQQAADIDNPHFVDNLFNTFTSFADQLIDGWKVITELSCKKESTTKIHEKMFQKKLIHLKSVLNQLIKLKEIFRKLEKQRKLFLIKNNNDKNNIDQKKRNEIANQIENLISIYSSNNNQKTDFDIFDYTNKLKWEEVMKQFKEKLEPIKNVIRQLKISSQQKENNSQQDQKKENISMNNTHNIGKQQQQDNNNNNVNKLTGEDIMNNKFDNEQDQDEDDDGDNNNDDQDNQNDMYNTGFSFHNPMYQTQVSWKID